VINAQSGCHAPPPNPRAAYNRSYTVNGRTYTPLRSAQGYDEVGIASWYGWESGSTTSMGTRFNPRDFSAASRVLPLPTCVQVTNLDNGLSALVLVNDRGPFVSGRLLDLSMGAAAALGITRTGTARVRVVALPDGANAPLQLAAQDAPQTANRVRASQQDQIALAAAQDPAAPQQFAAQPLVQASVPSAPAQPPIEVAVLPPLPSTPPAAATAPDPSDRQSSPVPSTLPQPALSLPDNTAAASAAMPELDRSATPQTFVQTGAFTLEANAQAERARLQAAGIADVLVVPGYIRGQMFYRVQIGPLVGGLDSALVQKLRVLGLTQYSVVQQ
jgi:rare lipoprotein A